MPRWRPREQLAFFSNSDRSVPVYERLRWVALATGATVSGAVATQQAADTLEDAGDTVPAANRWALGKFVDGLVASPPIFGINTCCAGDHLGRGTMIVIAPPPPELPWDGGEQLSAIDLLSVATRFQVPGPVDAGPFARNSSLLVPGCSRSVQPGYKTDRRELTGKSACIPRSLSRFRRVSGAVACRQPLPPSVPQTTGKAAGYILCSLRDVEFTRESSSPKCTGNSWSCCRP